MVSIFSIIIIHLNKNLTIHMCTKSGIISTWKLGSECSEIKQDAQRHQLEFPKVKLMH